MRKCFTLVYQLPESIGHKATYTPAAVSCSYYDPCTELFEFFNVVNLIFAVESEDHCSISLREAACCKIQRRYSYSSSNKERPFSCIVQIISIAQTCENIEFSSRCHACHLFGPVAEHFIDDGYPVLPRIT